MNASSSETVWLRTVGWEHFPGLVHGFSGRLGARGAAVLPLDELGFRLHTLKQVHGDHIVMIDPASSASEKPEADGLATAECGALLGIATADCVPVLMVDPEERVIAALHAGWRGSLKGIAHQAVALLSEQWNINPRALHVALGPSIGGCCYEVGPEVGDAITKRWKIRGSSAWRPIGEKGFLDLREVNRAQIEAAGVPRTQITFTGPCTFCDASFASYRREGAGAGRQLSVIGWRSR